MMPRQRDSIDQQGSVVDRLQNLLLQFIIQRRRLMKSQDTPSQRLLYANSQQKFPPSPIKPQPHCQKKLQWLQPQPQQFKRRSNISPLGRQERDQSPTNSAVSSRHQEFIRQMESSLLNQNRNLQDHNAFLVNQIKEQFKREKVYTRALRRAQKEKQELIEVNRQLQLQLEQLTKHTLAEIEKIQELLKTQRAMLVEELLVSSQSSDHKSEALGWETESTINQNLEELKTKVNELVRHPTFRYSFEFQKDFENKDQNNLGDQKNINKINSESKATDSSIYNIKSDEQFTQYLPPRPPALNPSPILAKPTLRK